jgi:hypothetical protein
MSINNNYEKISPSFEYKCHWFFWFSCKQQDDAKDVESVQSSTTRTEKCFLSFRKHKTMVIGTCEAIINAWYRMRLTEPMLPIWSNGFYFNSGDMSGDIEFYLPFPLTVSYLKGIKKKSSFSYRHKHLPLMKRTIDLCWTH